MMPDNRFRFSFTADYDCKKNNGGYHNYVHVRLSSFDTKYVCADCNMSFYKIEGNWMVRVKDANKS